MLGTEQWLGLPIATRQRPDGTVKGTVEISSFGDLALTTDGFRLHTEKGGFLYPAVAEEIIPAVECCLDEANFVEIEPDVWETLPDGFVSHLFEGAILSERFMSEALSGIGEGYSCAAWTDDIMHGPVRFRSADGQRTAYVMTYATPPKVGFAQQEKTS